MKRCDCERGRALSAAALPRTPRPRVISTESATICIELMAAMEFFPSEAGTRAGIADELASMCETEGQATWLAQRMTRLFRRWPGLQVLRQVFCSTHLPLDGVPALGTCEEYPDGFPSEAPPALQLPPLRAHSVLSGAPSVEAAIRDLAVAKDIKHVGRAKVRDVPVVRVTAENRIKQDDIDAAVAQYRETKAKEEQDGERTAEGTAATGL